MTAIDNGRRAFFLHSGAVLGAGVAATAGAAALTPGDGAPSRNAELEALRRQVACAEDREAIRELHRAFVALIEQQRYAAAAELFDERAELHLSGASATGKDAIRRLLVNRHRGLEAAPFHTAYRENALQPQDGVTVGDDGLQASATFYGDVELTTPLTGDTTVEAMARLQGQVADRHWETGRFEGRYMKTGGQWKVVFLSYRAA